MAKLILLTYADEKYKPHQEKLVSIAKDSQQFDGYISLDRIWLETNYFYIQNKSILDMPRGAGYWLWKPFIILNTLQSIEYGDIVLYMDCGDLLFNTKNIKNTLIEILSDKNFILTEGFFKNSDYTKRDCFISMGCDEIKYWDAIQLEAGLLAVKSTTESIKIVREWLDWCKKPYILTDSTNIFGGENLPGFVDHRHDQSVLTNLKIKYNIYASHELRDFVECNKNNI